MADQGIWFKLHCSALDDPDLDNLDIANFGRWAKLGAYIKRQGTDGVLTVNAPARALCGMLQVDNFDALKRSIIELPHVHVEEMKERNGQDRSLLISFSNWAKYQGDYSSYRTARYRQRERIKRRGEETRSRRDKIPSPTSPQTSSSDQDWKLGPTIHAALTRTRFVALATDRRFWQAQALACPLTDFSREVVKAEAWCSANPARAPKTSHRRFLANWFAKAQADAEERQ